MSNQSSDPWLSVTNASHLVLDGMPLRVNENYRPKSSKKESLPHGLRLDVSQSKALELKYEFAMETGFIQYCEDVEQRKADIAEKLRQRKLQAEAEAKKENDAREQAEKEKSKQLEPIRPAPKPPVATEPVIAKPSTNSILQPERASPVPLPASNPIKAGDMSLRDFENLSEDPFESAELKTINDMEVLQSVLTISQNGAPDTISVQHVIESPSQTEAKNIPDEELYQNPAEVLRNRPAYENVAIQRPSSELVASAKKKGPVASPRTSVLENNLNGLSQSASFDPKSETVNIETTSKGKPRQGNDYENNIPVKFKPPTKPKPVTNQPLSDNDGKTANGEHNSGSNVQSLADALSKDLSLAKYRPPGAPKGFSYVPAATDSQSSDTHMAAKDIQWPSLDSQKSIPSTPEVATNDVEPPLAKKPASNAPPRPKSLPYPTNDTNIGQLTAISDVSTGSKNKALLRKKVPPPKPPPPKTKPMNAAISSKNEVLENLLAMGFNKSQIDSAMSHLGSDPKQLVDHLCALQQLSVDGVKWENAQQGLFMFNSDLPKAEKFAKSYQHLLEFGFEDEKIREALINCDMEVDKALETLVP